MSGIVDLVLQHVLGMPELSTPFTDGKKFTPAQFKAQTLGLSAKHAGLSTRALRSDFGCIEIRAGKVALKISLWGHSGLDLEWTPPKSLSSGKHEEDAFFHHVAQRYGRVRIGDAGYGKKHVMAFGGAKGDEALFTWFEGAIGSRKAIRILVLGPVFPKQELKPVPKPNVFGISSAMLKAAMDGTYDKPSKPTHAWPPVTLPRGATLLRAKDGTPVAIKTPVARRAASKPGTADAKASKRPTAKKAAATRPKPKG
jgi:hypothetical protein